MKKIVAFIVVAFCSLAAVAQTSDNDGTGVSLTATIVSSSVKIITATDISINPNPIKSASFNLELQNLEKGKYSILLYNKDGKKYLLKTLNIEAGTAIETVELPKQVTSGTYILQVLGKTARFSKKMIVDNE